MKWDLKERPTVFRELCYKALYPLPRAVFIPPACPACTRSPASPRVRRVISTRQKIIYARPRLLEVRRRSARARRIRRSRPFLAPGVCPPQRWVPQLPSNVGFPEPPFDGLPCRTSAMSEVPVRAPAPSRRVPPPVHIEIPSSTSDAIAAAGYDVTNGGMDSQPGVVEETTAVVDCRTRWERTTQLSTTSGSVPLLVARRH